MRWQRWVGLVGFLCVAATVQAGPEPFVLGTLRFSECDFTHRSRGEVFAGQCARFEVPENPDDPAGRKISLHVGLIKAHDAEPEADPVFFLAGGPGQSAIEAYPMIAPGFSRILEKRHVILVDQRGTGDSNPLKCEGAEGESSFAADSPAADAQTAFVNDCLATLRERADPRYYTTTVAIGDLDRVRAAIGAEQINLIGGSYGTRVAQRYLHTYPDRVRSVVLDGVVPPDLILGNEHARNLETAVEGIFERCRKDSACQQAFGDPAEDFAHLRAELTARPIQVEFNDPKSGEPTTQELKLDDVAGVLRMFAYAPETAALLPLALHEAANGHAAALLAQSRLVSGDLGEQIMHAMQLSVICSEDAQGFRARPEDEATIMGNEFINVMLTQCAAWPKGARPDDFHTAAASAVPALLLSGEFDPVTPPRYGEATVQHFSKGRHLIAPGRGHGLLVAGCIPRLLADFVEGLEASKLEAKCLDDLAAIPAFVNRNGWTP